MREHNSNKSLKRWEHAQTCMLNYDADRVSTAQVIAFTDDDSCMQDYLLPSEILTAEGKLVARGYLLDRVGSLMGMAEDNEAVGITFIANFMMDFPTYVWTDMLADFRAYITKVAFPQTKVINGDYAEFWRAFKHLMDRGWEPDDHNNLLNFAYSSVKWHSRYDWKFVGGDDPQLPIMSHASHYRALGCSRPSVGPLEDTDPDRRARETRTALFYPTGRSSILSVEQVSKNYHPVDNGSRYRTYAKLIDSDVWKQYMLHRQHALQRYSISLGGNITVADSKTCGPPLLEMESSFCLVSGETRVRGQRIPGNKAGIPHFLSS